MIVLVSFSELECSLFAGTADRLKAGQAVHCINGIGSICDTVLSGAMDQTRIVYPHVIILNLDVPRQSWQYSLSSLKQNVFWRRIPVTGVGCLAKDALGDFYALGGVSCIRKPDSYSELSDVVETAVRYWMLVSVLPDQFVEFD